MAATKRLTLSDIEKRRADTYDYETALGTFGLKRITHGQKRDIQSRYLNTETGLITAFDDFLDELLLAAVAEPPLTPETLTAFPDEDGALRAVALHIGRKCGILMTPPDAPAEPNPTPEAPSTSG